MWYPPVVTVAPSAAVISSGDVALHCRVESGDTDSTAALVIYLAAAVAHVEAYTGTRLASQTVTIAADSFSDMARLPLAPVTSISSVQYVDVAGATQTLSSTVYRLIASGIEAFIELKPDQSWPTTKTGERITVTAVVGFASLPFDIRAAILLTTAHLYSNREATGANTIVDLPAGVAALLCNHRRGV